MTITTRLYTFFYGELVGQDAAHNRYFKERRTRKGAPEKRWVLFARDGRDPSAVAPEWHGWLHHAQDLPPNKQRRAHYGWEKPAMPNPTGTQAAYLPPGHMNKAGRPAPTLDTYQPWRP